MKRPQRSNYETSFYFFLPFSVLNRSTVSNLKFSLQFLIQTFVTPFEICYKELALCEENGSTLELGKR